MRVEAIQRVRVFMIDSQRLGGKCFFSLSGDPEEIYADFLYMGLNVS